MKKVAKIFIIVFLCVIYCYVCKIDNIPTQTIIFQGEEFNIGNFLGITAEVQNEKYKAIMTSTAVNKSVDSQVKNTTAKVKLFGIIDVKDVDVSVIEKTKVIPIGSIAGLKLYTHGVLVVGLGEIEEENGGKVKPYFSSNLQEGDTILQINSVNVENTEKLIEIINSSKGNSLKIKFLRDGQEQETEITPVKTKENQYKVGLWVRDTAAGIGTITYYNPSSKTYAALGHGIADIDTGNLIDISAGDFLTAKIVSVVKGKKGTPGKIQGSIENQKNIGKIYKNSTLGIYGTLEDESILNGKMANQLEVADRNEIKLGEASIMCTLDNSGTKEYKIEIKKIYYKNNDDNKSMLIKVTDKELLEKTGGIIQGMSGSPIIQNGKFIGAITNVLVNDPESGYAVFADMMLKEAQEIE